MTSSRLIPPMGSTPSKPAAFIARNRSKTEPFRPIVEYMIALRKLRLGVAQDPWGPNVATAAAPIVTFRNERRLIICFISAKLYLEMDLKVLWVLGCRHGQPDE